MILNGCKCRFLYRISPDIRTRNVCPFSPKMVASAGRASESTDLTCFFKIQWSSSIGSGSIGSIGSLIFHPIKHPIKTPIKTPISPKSCRHSQRSQLFDPRRRVAVPDVLKVSPVSEMSQLMASALSEVKLQLQDDLRQLVQEEMASLRRQNLEMDAMAWNVLKMWNMSRCLFSWLKMVNWSDGFIVLQFFYPFSSDAANRY